MYTYYPAICTDSGFESCRPWHVKAITAVTTSEWATMQRSEMLAWHLGPLQKHSDFETEVATSKWTCGIFLIHIYIYIIYWLIVASRGQVGRQWNTMDFPWCHVIHVDRRPCGSCVAGLEGGGPSALGPCEKSSPTIGLLWLLWLLWLLLLLLLLLSSPSSSFFLWLLFLALAPPPLSS